MGGNSLALKTVLALFIVFAGSLFAATCSADSYSKACASCSFDANGKMDQSCYKGYQSSGTACVASSFPLTATKYAKGECPEIDACASELTSCKAQYSTGNDSYDCKEGSVSTCFYASDQCINRAVAKCENIQACPTGPALILLVIGGTLLLGFVRRE